MIVDTAYDAIALKTKDCVLYDWDEDKDTDTICPGPLYDYDNSDDYEDFDEANEFKVKITATETYAWGYYVTDLVCLVKDESDSENDELCVQNYKWADVRHQTGLPQATTGVFGMPTISNPITKQFISELAGTQILEKNIFAIGFKSMLEQSFIDIGEIDEDKMSDKDDIVYFPFV